MRTIPSLVREAAEREGTALVVGDRRWSWSEFTHDVERSARAFVASGLAFGDRVAIWAPNSAEWIFAALGAQCAGGTIVPINTRFKGVEAAYVIARSGASFLVTSGDFLGVDYREMLASSAADLPDLAETIDIRQWNDFMARGDTITVAMVHSRTALVTEDHLSDIIFTSGTTGRPKGVMSRHGQTCEVFRVWAEVVGLRETDRYLIVNPFFHTFGYKAGFLACLITGATIVPEPVFDLATILGRVADERITVLPGPPTLYLEILDHPDRERHDLTSLRLAVTGAAAVPEEMIVRMRRELTFSTILTAYGLTESTGVVTMCRPDDDARTISSTSGRAIPGVEVRVVDDGGAEVAAGTPGEILCRGYNVMPGYWDDPVATAEAVDADGWLRTGDIGVMDARGYVAITDRKKDMFIVGGFNAYPAEIENLLLGHPDVARAAVVGVPDDRLGEVGAAFVVLHPGTDLDADRLITWCRRHMANYKVPRRIEFVDALPVNASGKVLKNELRARPTIDHS